MKNMFDKYDNLSPNYIPNNMYKYEDTAIDTLENPPRIAKNTKGNQIGYSWYLGEEFDFIYDINQDVDLTSVKLDIYSFRWEKQKTFNFGNTHHPYFRVDGEIDEILKRGIYYCIITIDTDGKSIVYDNFIIEVI